jgi:hypothetical protein
MNDSTSGRIIVYKYVHLYVPSSIPINCLGYLASIEGLQGDLERMWQEGVAYFEVFFFFNWLLQSFADLGLP